jgi:hypothetical protein
MIAATIAHEEATIPLLVEILAGVIVVDILVQVVFA